MSEEIDNYFKEENRNKSERKTDPRIEKLLKQYKKQDLKEAIIVDIDGTLSLANDRNPYDATKSILDFPNIPVMNLVEIMSKTHTIILMTGREEQSRDVTIKFLERNNVTYSLLLMRKNGDYRQDKIIKKELYKEFIKDKYFVEFVLDDRDQVIEMWRHDLGLPCFQVYYGDF